MTSDDRMPSSWELPAAFAFGVIFVSAMLIIAFIRPHPSDFEYTVFRIVISLAAAGVGAILPGFLQVDFKGWLRAGGAAALFVVTYFFAPATLQSSGGITPDIVAPSEDSKPYADSWLRLLDESDGDVGEAYNALASQMTSILTLAEFDSVIGNPRRALGAARSRRFLGVQAGDAAQFGSDMGPVRIYNYVTEYENHPEIIENLTLVIDEDEWHVYAYGLGIRNAAGVIEPYRYD